MSHNHPSPAAESSVFDPTLTVFTKPWKSLSLEALAAMVAEMGFQGVELPVRPGFQVEPEAVGPGLARAQGVFAARGLAIVSVAGEMDERTIRACGEAGVPVLRVMLRIDPKSGYAASVRRFQSLAKRLTPCLRESGVILGLQNHAGDFVGSAVGLGEVLAPLDPACVGAVLDLGHTALAGEPETIAIEVAAPRLVMVNLKNAIYRLDAEDGDGVAHWKRHWTTGPRGLTSWRRGVETLRARRYAGTICLTAEYHDETGRPREGEAAAALIREDMAFLRSLLNPVSDSAV